MEAAERDALFSIVHLYPRQVWDTYFYYKSSMLAAEIEQAMYPKFDLSKYTSLLRGLFWTAFAILLAFLVIPSIAPDPIRSLRFVGIAVLFALSAFPGYFIAHDVRVSPNEEWENTNIALDGSSHWQKMQVLDLTGLSRVRVRGLLGTEPNDLHSRRGRGPTSVSGL